MTLSAIYTPSHFNSKDWPHAQALMREHPFATLISNTGEVLPQVSHLPLHLRAEPSVDGQPVLLGHVAKANPHWRALEAQPQALAIFMGPQAYQSPTVYSDTQQVPTWNYLTVHCSLKCRLIHDALEKDRLLKRLIADHEPEYAKQWLGLAPDYQQKMLSAIVGLEFQVQGWVCKLKLNQHRPQAHATMFAQYSSGNEQARGLARWMQRLGLIAPQ